MDNGAREIARAVRDQSYDYVFRWMALVGLICLGAVVLWDFGFLSYVYIADTSQISAIITGIFALLSIYCFYMLVAYSPELRTLNTAIDEFTAGGELILAETGIKVGNYVLPSNREVTEHLYDIMRKHRFDPEGSREILVQSLNATLRARLRVGVITSDILYKLGLLGTVVGFIVMLGSISNLGEFEVSTMQAAMRAMSSGMAISLLTTITGLVCGTLLRIQFLLAEGLVATILQRTVRLTEVFIIPSLLKAKPSV